MRVGEESSPVDQHLQEALLFASCWEGDYRNVISHLEWDHALSLCTSQVNGPVAGQNTWL